MCVVTHVFWRLTKYRQRRRLTVANKAGILAEKVEKPSLVRLKQGDGFFHHWQHRE
jgi:hypothetical protein